VRQERCQSRVACVTCTAHRNRISGECKMHSLLQLCKHVGRVSKKLRLKSCSFFCVIDAVWLVILQRTLGIFLFTTVSRPGPGPTQPLIHWVPGVLSLGVEQPGLEADHLPSYSCRGQRLNGAISPLPQYAFMSWYSAKKTQGQHYLSPS